MLTGFFCTFFLTPIFCTGLPHQTLVQNVHALPQCPRVLEVTVGGRLKGGYVDDTDPSEAADQACAEAAGLPTYAGEWAFDRGLPNGLVEWYPVLDHASRIGVPAPPGQAGYILQSFSWGDNLEDGEAMGRCTSADTTASCAARYQAPDPVQLREMWCRAKLQRPHVILWEYAGGEPVGRIIGIMRHRCRPGR